MSDINTLNKAIEYLEEKQSLGLKPGLSRIKSALDSIENPQNSFKTIHIAGTNGKGTVAATIAHKLTKEGYKVGLFTSPWVISYLEQIQINGCFINDDSFIKGVRLIDKIGKGCTEFESLAVIAYNYFREEKVDYAVIECGMGGLGDATNVEEKNLSVITSISLDHTDFLGSTIEKIANEKSGILRKDCTCVLYNDVLSFIFKDKCKKLVTGGLNDNLKLVNAALNELGIPNVENLVSLPARCEIKNGVLLDGGHNVEAAIRLSEIIRDETAIIGMMRDKDVNGYLSYVAKKCKKIIAVSVNNSRSISAGDLADIAKKYCNDVIFASDINEALSFKPSLICGSFYLIREIYNLI